MSQMLGESPTKDAPRQEPQPTVTEDGRQSGSRPCGMRVRCPPPASAARGGILITDKKTRGGNLSGYQGLLLREEVGFVRGRVIEEGRRSSPSIRFRLPAALMYLANALV